MCKLRDVPILLWVKTNPLQIIDFDVWVKARGSSSVLSWTFSGVCRSGAIVYTFGFEAQVLGAAFRHGPPPGPESHATLTK